jgi:two-component system OmpR family sensor kinase
MSWSLQTRLARWLVVAIAVLGIAATAVSYWWALNEAHEIQDQQLDQIAAVLRASRIINLAASASTDIIDEDARLLIQSLAHSVFPPTLDPGFHTLNVHGKRWRVLVTTSPQGAVAVAQRIAWRNESARAAARGTLVPVFALIPLLLLAVTLAVRANFKPVAALAASLDARDEYNLATLPETGVAVEIKPFVASINSLLRRLDLALNQQRRFVADAAHELRTPLAALNLQAQNLANAHTPDDMRSRLLPLQAGLARSEQLLAQLLSLARQQNAGVDPDLCFDADEQMRRVVGDLYTLAEARSIDLGITASAQLELRGSADAFYTVLRNAVDNALRYTPDGGRVDLRACVDDHAFVVEVEDSGPGIAALERERVFDAFYRVAGSAGEGSGLGLTIAATAAQQLGGAISLDQADAGGLLFRYRQPLSG